MVGATTRGYVRRWKYSTLKEGHRADKRIRSREEMSNEEIKLSRRERKLRTKLYKLTQGLPQTGEDLTKSQVREFHATQRLSKLGSLNGRFDGVMSILRASVADPNDIDIATIRPTLIPVKAGSPESEVFAAASLLWTVPVSQGFGRRMRFIVRDDSNGKLIGIIGLTDPVFNLRPRDNWVGWNSGDRRDRLVNVMDAFVLGAVPPYSHLLGGKLVALLAASEEVVQLFRGKYGKSEGIISKQSKDAHLAMLTTTSALGRSSLYNRLRMPGSVEYLTDVDGERVPDWQTQGFGHFHIDAETFRRLQQLLDRRKHPYAKGNRFGDGPNWKMRVIRQATNELGISLVAVQHGIKRQVYVVPLASNTREFLLGQCKHLDYVTKSIADITEFWRERWAAPRATRCPDWQSWDPDTMICELEALHLRSTAYGGQYGAG